MSIANRGDHKEEYRGDSIVYLLYTSEYVDKTDGLFPVFNHQHASGYRQSHVVLSATWI